MHQILNEECTSLGWEDTPELAAGSFSACTMLRRAIVRLATTNATGEPGCSQLVFDVISGMHAELL